MNWILALALGLIIGTAYTLVACRSVFSRHLRAAKREAAELTQRMEKLEQVRSTFVANVTHELKTPLTSIKGYMELLRDGERDEATRESFYDIIDIEADRLHALIDDILQLSEIEHSKDDPRQQDCDLYALGRELTDRFRPQAEKAGITFAVRIPEDMVIRGNTQRIKQLLSNLVDNAIKYNVQGGAVLLRAWHEQKQTVIAVSDTGIGIPEEHVLHLFERFYRVDKGRSRALGGTGLGLSIVKHAAQLHGGTVQVETEPEKGSMFTVKLPE